MNSWIESFKEYFFVLIIGLVIGILFLIKGYENQTLTTKHHLARYVIHGVVISMFVTWAGFEIFTHLGFPYKLSVAFGGAMAYLGTDRITLLIEKIIQSKLG